MHTGLLIPIWDSYILSDFGFFGRGCWNTYFSYKELKTNHNMKTNDRNKIEFVRMQKLAREYKHLRRKEKDNF